MSENRFWLTSYDDGLTDLDPSLWETSFIDAIKPVFTEFKYKTALAYMGTEINFGMLDRYSNSFAQMLISNGFQKGDIIGINLPNMPEYIISWLGILKAGCVVSGVSPLLSDEEMLHQLKDSNAKGLVTLDAIFAARLINIEGELPDLKLVVTASIGGFLPFYKRIPGKLLGKIPKGKVTNLVGKIVIKMNKVIKSGAYVSEQPSVSVSPDDIAYVQYTGGTTGPPKGAMLTHRSIIADHVIVQKWLKWKKGEGIALSGFPFFHIAGLFFNANCIYLGCTQVLIPNPRDTGHICKELDKYKPEYLVNVPTLYQMLIADPAFSELDHSAVKSCICSASPFPPESQRELEKIVGKGVLLEVYGMTETSPLTAMNPVDKEKKLGTIGLPLPNTDIILKDPGTGQEVAQGEPGEICVKGPQVMKGYYNKPEETEACFDDDGYFHTGDVAVQDAAGYLKIVDRTKDMIIVSGFKVFSKKVEEIMTEHPAVDMIATIGIENPERPGSELVKAYITTPPGYMKDKDIDALKIDIRDFAKDKLAAYEVPKIIEIMDEMPLTTVGKIDKKVLRKM